MIRHLAAATLLAATLTTGPAHADPIPNTVTSDWIDAGCTTTPTGVLRCAVAFDTDMHRLDVTYAYRGRIHYDTTSKYGPRGEGETRTYAGRVVPGLRLTCDQVGTRVTCRVTGWRSYKVQFYRLDDAGVFWPFGGGGVRAVDVGRQLGGGRG